MGWKFWKQDNPMDPQQQPLAQSQPPGQVSQQQPASTWPAQGSSAPAVGFRMVIEDVFHITGRGTVVTGRVGTGRLATGQSVTLTRNGQVLGSTTVVSVEQFSKTVDVAAAGDNVGLTLDGVERDDVARGDVLSA